MNYEQKYLKYKTKYLKSKQEGGLMSDLYIPCSANLKTF